MRPEPEPQDPVVLSYLALRRAVGWVACGLPFVLVIPWFWQNHGFEPSISDYYHTWMRNFFVGGLCAIALFMFCCRGYDCKDEAAGLFSSICAFGVALFPCAPDGNPTKLQCRIGDVHYIFATLLFATLATFCLFLFKLSAEGIPITRNKRTRNKIYTVCGCVIVACMLLIWFLRNSHLMFGPIAPKLLFESLALVSFGFAWLIKGEIILKDPIVPPTRTTNRLFLGGNRISGQSVE